MQRHPGRLNAALLAAVGALTACAATTATSASDHEPPQRPGRAATVSEVVDGDTVHIRTAHGDLEVRVIGIDTPETVHPDEPVECGGTAASAAAVRLLADERVRVVVDPTQGRHDRYGRALAYVELANGRDFGALMLQRGYAREYTYAAAYARQDQYRALEEQARNAGRGLWDHCQREQS